MDEAEATQVGVGGQERPHKAHKKLKKKKGKHGKAHKKKHRNEQELVALHSMPAEEEDVKIDEQDLEIGDKEEEEQAAKPARKQRRKASELRHFGTAGDAVHDEIDKSNQPEKKKKRCKLLRKSLSWIGSVVSIYVAKPEAEKIAWALRVAVSGLHNLTLFDIFNSGGNQRFQ